MKLAFTTAVCPQWDLLTVAAKAKELGYGAVEICVAPERTGTELLGSDPDAIREAFAAAGVGVACISAGRGPTGNTAADKQAAESVRRLIDAAGAMGCGLVSVAGLPLKRGQTLAAAADVVARWVGPMADYAAEHGVGLLIENSGTFRTSRDLWFLMETVDHYATGVSWDVLSAVLAGEAASVAVPVLNTRIRHVRVRDAVVEASGAQTRALGEGNLKLTDLMHRLMGIGFDGCVTVHGVPAEEPQATLTAALAKLKQWTAPPAKPTPPAKPKPAPAAAKAAAAS